MKSWGVRVRCKAPRGRVDWTCHLKMQLNCPQHLRAQLYFLWLLHVNIFAMAVGCLQFLRSIFSSMPGVRSEQKHLEVAVRAERSTAFTCKARWWPCPTGDPNARKSPTCAVVMKAFAELVDSKPSLFFSEKHWIGVGNSSRIQNGLRALNGALLLYGLESKPMFDPNFPKKTVDTGRFLDLIPYLECANGGKFEWGTGQDHHPSKPPATATKSKRNNARATNGCWCAGLFERPNSSLTCVSFHFPGIKKCTNLPKGLR